MIITKVVKIMKHNMKMYPTNGLVACTVRHKGIKSTKTFHTKEHFALQTQVMAGRTECFVTTSQKVSERSRKAESKQAKT